MNLSGKENKRPWEAQKSLNPANYIEAALGVSERAIEVVTVTTKASSVGKALLMMRSWEITERRPCGLGVWR